MLPIFNIILNIAHGAVATKPENQYVRLIEVIALTLSIKFELQTAGSHVV